jgi:hypothetical protein
MAAGVVRIVAHSLKHQQAHGLISEWEKSAKFSDCNTQKSIQQWIVDTFFGAEVYDGHSAASERTGAGWKFNTQPDIVLPDAVASASMAFIHERVSLIIIPLSCYCS